MDDTVIESLQRRAHHTVARLGYGITSFRRPLRAPIWNRNRSILKRIDTATTPLECAEIASFAAACSKIPGDIAEAGVFLGGTAAIILDSLRAKTMHLFDTFEGLPGSERQFSKGDWCGSLADVRRNLEPWKERTAFHPGIFPVSASGLDDLRFSFVHLDLDLYQSTIDALRWFWPKMSIGGVILSHDYPTSDGVFRAFHEFFDANQAAFFPLSGNQVVAVKLCRNA